MKWLVLTLAVFFVVGASTVSAQLPVARPDADQAFAMPSQPSMATMTPEMWFYMQEMKRYDDPQLAVRRNAEFRAAQRRNRLAAQKWFGFSNQRPQANPVPWTGTYSPFWVGNSWDPYRWVGRGNSPIIIIGRPPTYDRY